MKKSIFTFAALLLTLGACGSKETKIDPVKDANDFTKGLIEMIDNYQVSDSTPIDSLEAKLEATRAAFVAFYEPRGKELLDTLLNEYETKGKARVDSALEAKRNAARAPQQ